MKSRRRLALLLTQGDVSSSTSQASLRWTGDNLPSSLSMPASSGSLIASRLRLPLGRLRFGVRRQSTQFDLAILIGDSGTTLVVQALINAGMVRHEAFASQNTMHRRQHVCPRIVRTEIWETASRMTEGAGPCVFVVQKGFMPSNVTLADMSMRSITVIDAESLIAASVRRHQVQK